MLQTDEARINANHKARYAEAQAKYGGKFSVPVDVDLALGEIHRKEWVAYYAAINGEGEERTKRDKTRRMTDWCATNVGAVVTAGDLAAAVDAAIGTAYSFIADHRSQFRKDARGTYIVLDVSAERAAAKSAASPTTLPPAPSAAAVAAANEAAIVNTALAHLTGERPTPQVGKP
jgi:hypothetical protein